jgi:hypothetical protein
MKQSSSWEVESLLPSQEIPYILWTHKCSSLYSQEPLTDPCPEPGQSSPYLHPTSLKFHINIILQSVPRFCRRFKSYGTWCYLLVFYDICVHVRRYKWTLSDILNTGQYVMSCKWWYTDQLPEITVAWVDSCNSRELLARWIFDWWTIDPCVSVWSWIMGG